MNTGKTTPTDRRAKGVDVSQIYYHGKLLEFIDFMEPIPMPATQLKNIIKVSFDSPS